MNITIETKTADNTPVTFQLQVKPEDTVESLQETIHAARNIEPDDQRLLFDGKQLEEGCELRSYGIKDGSVIQLICP